MDSTGPVGSGQIVNHLKQLGRWPLLLAACLCLIGSVYLYRQTEDPNDGRSAATILVLFAAFLLGGFLVDWGGRDTDTDNTRVSAESDDEGNDDYGRAE